VPLSFTHSTASLGPGPGPRPTGSTRRGAHLLRRSASSCYLNEFYGSSEAFLLHFESLGPKLGAMLEISPLEEMIVLGNPSLQVREMLGELGAKFYTPYVGFSR